MNRNNEAEDGFALKLANPTSMQRFQDKGHSLELPSEIIETLNIEQVWKERRDRRRRKWYQVRSALAEQERQ